MNWRTTDRRKTGKGAMKGWATRRAKPRVEVTGIWLDAHSGRIRVRAEIGGEWRTIIDERNDEGHISHIVEPAGMLSAKPSVELA